MIQKKKVYYPIFAVLLFLVAAVVIAQAAGTPGSTNDPLVTKSYVDQQIAQLAAKIGSSGTSSGGGTVNNADVDQLKTDVGDLTKFVIDALTDIENIKSRVSVIENGFVVLQMNKGQKLILDSGAEVVLRSGQATAIKGESGTLVDISTGTDLTDGMKVPQQHLVITPKGDGRGLSITANDSYLIVKGGYTIK